MKTVKKIILGIIFAFALFSCENPISLGTRLDIDGPVVNFTSPAPRDSVLASFILEGKTTDNGNIKMQIIKVEKDNNELPRQWRYTGSHWEISEDSGLSWAPLSAVLVGTPPTPAEPTWVGNNIVTWSIPVDLKFYDDESGTMKAKDGEYKFKAQAWDSGNMSNDNSVKTLILIIDNHPPIVTLNKPYLYDKGLYNSGYVTITSGDPLFEDYTEFTALRTMTDYKNPQYVSKFQTGSFDLQWNINEQFTIKWFDLRFYVITDNIDTDAEAGFADDNVSLKDNDYIYRFKQTASSSSFLPPNGSVKVPTA